MSRLNQGYLPFSEPFYAKVSDGVYEPGSETADQMALPRSDFEPYYTDLVSCDPEIEANFLSIQDLNVAQESGAGMSAAAGPADLLPPFRSMPQYATELSSEPPPLPYELPMTEEPRYIAGFDDLPSSPPSSPPRSSPARRPQLPSSSRAHLDPLGISHPYGHRPQASISRLIAEAAEPTSEPDAFGYPHNLQSPFLVPPHPQNPTSPATRVAPSSSVLMGSRLPFPPIAPSSAGRGHMPDLSPALSDASSISPDPGSPEHDGFCWQPIVTVPRSELTESIIEQQRKPRQKRKSCLPDGVVEEYVGTTDTEGVYVCLYPNCQRLFKRTYNLRSHIQTHLCDRPYMCKICDATFVRPHDLRRHERSHSNRKPYMCPCGKGFSRQDAMQRHRLREICEGAISSGIPKSPKPRGRPKGKKNTPSQSPMLSKSPELPPPGTSDGELEAQHHASPNFVTDHHHHHHHHSHNHSHEHS